MSNSLIIILSIGFIQAWIFILLLFQKKQKQKSDWFLMGWFMLFSSHLVFMYFFEGASKIHMVITKIIGLLNGPFLLLYARFVFNISFKSRDFIHFSTFIAFLLCAFLINEKHNLIYEGTLISAKIISLFVYALYVRLWLIKKLKSIKKLRADNFYIDTQWISVAALMLLIYSIIRTIHFFTHFAFNIHFSSEIDVLMYVVIFTIIGFYGLKFKVVYDTLLDVKPSKSEYKNSPLKKEDIRIYKNQIDDFFNTNDDYLNADFSLGQLSTKLKIPKHYLSEIINLEMGTTFYDIINAKRIQTAIRLLHSGNAKNITFEALGYDVGYNSKSSFFYHFKKITGKTPRQYALEISSN